MATGDSEGPALKPFRHWGWAWPAAVIGIAVVRAVSFTSLPPAEGPSTPAVTSDAAPAAAPLAVPPPASGPTNIPTDANVEWSVDSPNDTSRIVDRPTPAQTLLTYPAHALMMATSGAARIRCQVSGLGRLTGCVVLNEYPQDAGFGQAAIAAGADFRIKPNAGPAGTGVSAPFEVSFQYQPTPSSPSAAPEPQGVDQTASMAPVPKRRALSMVCLPLLFALAVFGAMAWADLPLKRRKRGADHAA
jgi:TonB family protein